MKRSTLLLCVIVLLFSCEKSADFEGVSGDYSESIGNSSGGAQQDSTLEPGQLTAGEWNDLENWQLWDTLIHGQTYSEMAEYWDLYSDHRISVSLENKSAEKLVGIQVELLDNNSTIWSTLSDHEGVAELWYKPFSNSRDMDLSDLQVRILDQIYDLKDSFSPGVLSLMNLDTKPLDLPYADIAFMVDATGSMSDELEYLKVELMDVIDQVQASNPTKTIRMGSVFYRDEGDKYLTRESDFSERISKTINFIKDQKADGGGDFPEAVHTALEKSINELNWSPEAYARILFMVLDAPPHHDDQVMGIIQNRIADAAEKGIKLIPVVASGIDKETEFLMRYMAIFTNGTYVFLTNHSGIGNDHLEPTIGQYEVEMLNDLLVRLISDVLK